MKAICGAYDCVRHPRHGDLAGEGPDPALDPRREVECYEAVVDGRGYVACGASEWEVAGVERFLSSMGVEDLPLPDPGKHGVVSLEKPYEKPDGPLRRCSDCQKPIGPNETWMSNESKPEQVYCVECGRLEGHRATTVGVPTRARSAGCMSLEHPG